MTTVMVWSYKGGVSKTATALNLAAAWLESDPAQRIRLIDLCPSRGLSDYAGALPAAEFVGCGAGHLGGSLGGNLGGLTLIDCAPEMTPADVAAVMGCCDFVLIPAMARAGAAEMAIDAAQTAATYNKPFRVFLTGYTPQQGYQRAIRDELRAALGETMCKTIIANSHAICAAEYEKRTVIDYAPNSPGARGYRMLARELKTKWLYEHNRDRAPMHRI